MKHIKSLSSWTEERHRYKWAQGTKWSENKTKPKHLQIESFHESNTHTHVTRMFVVRIMACHIEKNEWLCFKSCEDVMLSGVVTVCSSNNHKHDISVNSNLTNARITVTFSFSTKFAHYFHCVSFRSSYRWRCRHYQQYYYHWENRRTYIQTGSDVFARCDTRHIRKANGVIYTRHDTLSKLQRQIVSTGQDISRLNVRRMPKYSFYIGFHVKCSCRPRRPHRTFLLRSS